MSRVHQCLSVLNSLFVKDIQQIVAMMLKNVVLTWRSWKTNLVQLVLPFILVGFIWVLSLVVLNLQDNSAPILEKGVNSVSYDLKRLGGAFLLATNYTNQPPTKMLYTGDAMDLSRQIVLQGMLTNYNATFPNVFQPNFVSEQSQDAIDELLYSRLEFLSSLFVNNEQEFFGGIDIKSVDPKNALDVVYTFHATQDFPTEAAEESADVMNPQPPYFSFFRCFFEVLSSPLIPFLRKVKFK